MVHGIAFDLKHAVRLFWRSPRTTSIAVGLRGASGRVRTPSANGFASRGPTRRGSPSSVSSATSAIHDLATDGRNRHPDGARRAHRGHRAARPRPKRVARYRGPGPGAFAALAVNRTLASLLTEVGPLDPVVAASACALALIAASLACVLPALKASRLDPVQALNGGSQ
jgi:hypothetical protein